MLKDKRFLKFLIPSLIGAFLFVIPVQQEGNLTIPVAVLANKLLDLMGEKGTLALTRLMGTLLILLAVQMVLNGITEYIKHLPGTIM